MIKTPPADGNGLDNQSPRKSTRTIAQHQIAEGLASIQRSTRGLLLSGFSGGLDVGFSLFLMAVMLTQVEGKLPQPVVEMLVASMYAIGFVFVILGRSELFTEQTALAVLPVLNQRASLLQLGRLWGLVFVSNIMGGAVFAWIAVEVGPAMGVIQPAAFGKIAGPVVSHPWPVILASGILAGWLMGLLGWLVAAGRDTISQILIVAVVTTAIGFAHLHHSIVGTIEVLAGVFSGQGVTMADYGHFLLWTTLGNIIGGSFFVALTKYGQAITGPKNVEPVELPLIGEEAPEAR